MLGFYSVNSNIFLWLEDAWHIFIQVEMLYEKKTDMQWLQFRDKIISLQVGFL